MLEYSERLGGYFVIKILAAIVHPFIKQSIIFESKPIFSDNTKAVYDEMIHRGYDKNYRFVWFAGGCEFAEIRNGKISYWNSKDRKTIKEKIRNYSVAYRTKCLICCNEFLTSKGCGQKTSGKNQISFYLSHGTPIKSVKRYYTSPGVIDFMISASQELKALMSYEFSVPVSHVVALGFPRNDVFSKPAKDLKLIFGDYKKIIIWYPTYRQNTNHSIDLAGDSLPLIHDENNARKLNNTARKNSLLLVVKPHFVQDLNVIHKLKLSNILFIDEGFFTKNGITSYEMLAASDALITDYSSVYYDYTLRDRPIAVVWEDIEEYRKFPGFAVDLDDYLKGAEKIYNIDELCLFIERVANNEDLLQEERREIRNRVNISTDGLNTKRVVDLIEKMAKL